MIDLRNRRIKDALNAVDGLGLNHDARIRLRDLIIQTYVYGVYDAKNSVENICDDIITEVKSAGNSK